MRILITNDDGIASPALPRLAAWARQFGEVTVVAPKREQSGKSQSIDFYREIEIKRVDLDGVTEAYAVDSTPADCVRYAVIGLERSYDLLFSGINRGFNLGYDVAYSGTVGAVMEGARFGIPSIALSTDVTAGAFDAAFAQLDGVWAYFRERDLLRVNDLYSVNIPVESHGIRITRRGYSFYADRFEHRGNDMYAQVGEPVRGDVQDMDLDSNAVWNGYISITPLTADKTDLIAFEALKEK
ncbi:MAG: 5'/3'-nucleotidase SurE [Clostridia bacterium]|nr:5'/3'-nucleotidase SurE [Clostridia bacterium]